MTLPPLTRTTECSWRLWPIRVLLEVVADTRDIGSDFDSVRQTNTSDLSESRVRLLRRHRHDSCAGSPLLRATLKSRRLRLVLGARPALSYQLIDCRHLSIHSVLLCGRTPSHCAALCRTGGTSIEFHGQHETFLENGKRADRLTPHHSCRRRRSRLRPLQSLPRTSFQRYLRHRSRLPQAPPQPCVRP